MQYTKVRIWVSFFLLIFNFFCYAQEELKSDDCIKEQTEKIYIKLDSVSKTINETPQQSYDFAMRVFKDEKYKDNIKTQIIAQQIIGNSLSVLGENIKARHYNRKAYQSLTPKLKYSLIGISVTNDYAANFIQNNNLKYGLKLYLKISKLIDSVCPEPNIKRFLNYSNIAKVYTKKEKLQMALVYYQKAVIEAEKLQDKLWLSSAFNNLGYFHNHYFSKDDSKIALEYYNKAIKLLDLSKKEHELFDVNIDENIGQIFMKKKQYKKSTANYIHISKIRRKHKKYYDAIQSDLYLLNCLIMQNNHKEVKKTTKTISNFYQNKRNIEQNYLDANFNKFYNLKLFYLKKNNIHKAYTKESLNYMRFLTDKFDYQDSISKKEICSYIDLQKRNFKKQLKHEKEIVSKNKEIHQTNEKLYAIFLITAALIILTLLLLIRIKKTKHNKIEQDCLIQKLKLANETLEKQKLNKLLESKQKDIINIVTNSSMRIDFLTNILTRIKTEFKKSINKEQKLKPIIFDIKSQLNIEERLIALQSDLSKANAYFDANLMDKHPNLTKLEREICSFIKLNFSTKEIAQIRNTSIDSVKMARYRIRKKLNLTPEEELDQAIQSI